MKTNLRNLKENSHKFKKVRVAMLFKKQVCEKDISRYSDYSYGPGRY